MLKSLDLYNVTLRKNITTNNNYAWSSINLSFSKTLDYDFKQNSILEQAQITD